MRPPPDTLGVPLDQEAANILSARTGGLPSITATKLASPSERSILRLLRKRLAPGKALDPGAIQPDIRRMDGRCGHGTAARQSMFGRLDEGPAAVLAQPEEEDWQ